MPASRLFSAAFSSISGFPSPFPLFVDPHQKRGFLLKLLRALRATITGLILIAKHHLTINGYQRSSMHSWRAFRINGESPSLLNFTLHPIFACIPSRITSISSTHMSQRIISVPLPCIFCTSGKPSFTLLFFSSSLVLLNPRLPTRWSSSSNLSSSLSSPSLSSLKYNRLNTKPDQEPIREENTFALLWWVCNASSRHHRHHLASQTLNVKTISWERNLASKSFVEALNRWCQLRGTS